MEEKFVVRPFEVTSIGWWHTERENLDLSPPYQRKSGVWSEKDKAFLIDSIINGFDVPKFYVADFTYFSSSLNRTGKQYAVIDGRQRFEAIFDFLDNKIKLDKAFVYFADPSLSLAGMRASEIESKYPRIFKRIESFNLSVMSVLTNREERINDLFVRLNKSKPLTGAEVRSAITGEAVDAVRKVSLHSFFDKNIDFSTLRKQHENVAAKIVLFEYRGGFVETKKINLDRFANEVEKTEKYFSEVYKLVEKNLNLMQKRFRKKDPLLKNSGILPVYYWLIRNNPDDISIRSKLLQFDELRRTDVNNLSIVAFNKASRSTNDEHSYRVRFLILDRYVKSGLIDDYYGIDE